MELVAWLLVGFDFGLFGHFLCFWCLSVLSLLSFSVFFLHSSGAFLFLFCSFSGPFIGLLMLCLLSMLQFVVFPRIICMLCTICMPPCTICMPSMYNQGNIPLYHAPQFDASFRNLAFAIGNSTIYQLSSHSFTLQIVTAYHSSLKNSLRGSLSFSYVPLISSTFISTSYLSKLLLTTFCTSLGRRQPWQLLPAGQSIHLLRKFPHNNLTLHLLTQILLVVVWHPV